MGLISRNLVTISARSGGEARSRRDLGAIWGRGAISARSQRDLGTRPLHEDYVGTEFASITVHMHKLSSKFVKMAPNDDIRGVRGRGHQEGTLKTCVEFG